MKKIKTLSGFRQALWRLCLVFCLCCQFVQAQNLPANFQRVTVATGISNATAMAFTPDGRILVCQQNGQLRVVKNGSLLSTPAVSLSVNTSGERGLIGVAVDPNFTSNQYIYLYYTHTSGPHNRLSRFTMSGDVASSELAILDLPTLSGIYHNGGGLAFGNDGKLYVAVGENQVGSNSQNLDNYLGKLLRINSDGTVPSGNPFTGGAARSRIWAYGLRNPFTIASDPVSGKIFVNDVGNATWEEINDATTGGRNFGWPNVEGMCTSGCSGYTNPIYVYATNRSDPPPNGQGCAINGGTFFNGAISNYPSTYNGRYFFLDYCGTWIDNINPASPSRVSFGTSLGDGNVYIKQGTDGNLYYLRRNTNTLYRIVYTGTQAPVITSQPQSISVPQGGTASFSVTAAGNPAPAYQWRKGTTNISGATSATYTINNVQPSHAGQYNVVVSNSAGSVTSNNATLTVTQPNTLPVATVTSPSNGVLFRSGDVISFSGSATDAEDGTIPASAFEWWVDFHHATHTHPGPALTDGVSGGSFTADLSGHNETNIWYRIYLAVQDSQGGRDTSYVEIFPVTSNLTLQTQPAGLQVRLDDVPFTAPYTTEAVSGASRSIAAISPQTVGGVTYLFDHWSQGGAAAQTITITDNDATYTAHFRVAPPPVNITPVHDAYVRDGTNAAITHGTTDPTLLITKVAPSGQLNNNREAYLQFDLASISGNIASVVLRVYGKVDLTTAPSVLVGVFPVANTTWTENTITWNNKPASGTTELATATVTNSAYSYINWDVTNYVRSELLAGRTKVSFAMKSLQAHDPRIFWNSAEFGSNPPQLSIIAEAGNIPPTVSITAPANGATFTAPANITINASAADADGTVTLVEFFNGATKIGEDATAPYSITWNNVAAGSYSLTARATDDSSAATTSAPVSITVQPPASCDPVTASADDGNVPANVLDDNLNTRWSANGDGQWIQFCLANTATVSGVQIAFYNGTARTSSFDVLVGNDGVNWTTAASGLVSSGASLNLETFSFTPVSAKYVRIVGHGNSVNLWNSYTEVKIVTATAPPCDPVTASDDDGNVPANVLDDNLSTRWSANGDGQWIQFCLANTATVSGVQIAFYNGTARTSSFDVLVGNDGVNWTTAASGLVSSGTSLNLETFSFTPVSAKYVRIVGHGNSVNLWNSYTEVRIQTQSGLRIVQPVSEIPAAIPAFTSFPNPFRESNTILFHLDEPGHTHLAVFDIMGKQVAVLVNAHLPAGDHRVVFKAADKIAGIYLLKMVHNGQTITRKIMKE